MRKVKCGKVGCKLEPLPPRSQFGRGLQRATVAYLVPFKKTSNKVIQKGGGKKSSKKSSKKTTKSKKKT